MFSELINKIVKQTIERETRECELLVAHFIKQNPEVPIEQIELRRTQSALEIRFSVGLKTDDN